MHSFVSYLYLQEQEKHITVTEVIQEGDFSYLETNPGKPVLLLLHGLFGATGNFAGIQEHFKDEYNVVTPLLPILSMPIKKLSLEGLLKHIHEFVILMGYKNFHLVGNSLGGHLAQMYALTYPDKVSSITLTGSSGLFENSMGSTFPKRGDYEFIKRKTQDIFYDPATATKEVVDEVFETVNDRNKAIRVVVTAKSAIRNNLEDRLINIEQPVLLVWGREDPITPLWVGEKFNKLLPNSVLSVMEKCGHAPMMEQPDKFNTILSDFLDKVINKE